MDGTFFTGGEKVERKENRMMNKPPREGKWSRQKGFLTWWSGRVTNEKGNNDRAKRVLSKTPVKGGAVGGKE